MTNVEDGAQVALPTALFALIAILVGADLGADALGASAGAHLWLEVPVMVLAAAGVALLWRRLSFAEKTVQALDRRLDEAHADAARWRQEAHEALRGLGQAIDQQFERWGLTAAEREVGLLLLKGLSHREVAELRGTGEQTVRQQAQTVYRKAGLRGRADLAAFFLEDLLLPPGAPEGRP